MATITKTSEKGVLALLAEEGEVLKAYRCPAGVWTISGGLTAASGVVKPKKGMVITRAESRRLMREALTRNYEPRVAAALETDQQHVFDGGLMFDWNTGAIKRASWVKLIKQGQFTAARPRFMEWVRAGGKIVKGLVGRRGREWTLIQFGIYPSDKARPAVDAAETVAADLAKLGFKGKPADAVRAFQAKSGLRVDGIVGPATRAALQRALAARLANQTATGGSAGGVVVGAGGETGVQPDALAGVDVNTALWAIGGGVAVFLAIYLACLLWRYRGPAFAWLPEPIKDAFERAGIVVGRRVRT